MALGTYQELQTAILGWLARPGDPLVAPAVPDMIRLFESEANRRLRTGWQENGTTLVIDEYGAAVLPEDFVEARNITDSSGAPLLPVSGTQAYDWTLTGIPKYYTITSRAIWLNPAPDDAAYEVAIDYLAAIPPLSDTVQSNWLLGRAPDCYLFGALAEAEGYIGHDERIQIWLQRREAAIEGLNAADRKYRWPGPMQIRAAL
jgi:hypothetical protein